ncbi:type II toxin-antitoxin system HipA family toxin [Glaciimonas immobilis]|uniref:Serine/threonine-protein kinase HipA n=1 Tax=Glaciimonas immobilis TaxID=728004 RepID=A0A840RRI2_9BURK|nr:type II toxin-antitoxin system HipA family toxin [Glaciimonas immobilis]KAF3999828.1 type II toxin-antitoxin system HipA family toxin [Glaciimonas immobilis]MBB5200303.1 serine/threonine-protein kinase HipA [Glaciimonas immobilis]
MAQELAVWMNGQLVGTWSKSRLGVSIFEYESSWLASEYARPLSISLPIPIAGGEIRGEVVQNYFDNLLPDAQHIRERLQKKFTTKDTDAYSLLEAIGRDCVGAVQLLPLGEKPEGFDRIDSRPLSEADVSQILIDASRGTTPAQAPEDNPFRISLAGAQEKTALLRIGDEWHLPQGATPTSHILKLPLGLIGGYKGMDMRTSVENEWLCAQLLTAIGFNVAVTDMTSFLGQKVLVVERFDRRWMDDNGWLARLPQEDFCQVFGLPSSKKYEVDGGPGIVDILSKLEASQNREDDRLRFLLVHFVFWLLAALDGHAKNFSIALQQGGGYMLTPFYDVLSFWPVIGNAPNKQSKFKAPMAMGVRGKSMHRKMVEIQARHWQVLAQKSGLPEAFETMIRISSEVENIFEAVRPRLPPDFPMKLWDAIYAGTRAQAKSFQTGLHAPELGASRS